MTTATRPRPATAKLPPPEHGERRCYQHGCRQPECSDAHYRYMSRLRLDHARGNRRRVPSAPASDHVQALSQAGWSLGQIAAAAHCQPRTISDLLARRYPTTHGDIANRILATTITISTAPSRTHTDATGTIRRVQALMAIGHTMLSVANAIGMAPTALSNVSNGKHPTVTIATALATADLYKRWANTPGTNNRARNRAAHHGWPPPAAWDDIDNPHARPDWTGHCGTDRGWNVHRITGIPVCPRCETAHQQWFAERAHLTPAERGKQAFAARHAANDRGITLAEDIRELLRLGCDREQTAARLGISRDVLNATLSRYPEPAAGADDDGEEAA
jgi:lambda repressor-like predicted transcriptional regulator